MITLAASAESDISSRGLAVAGSKHVRIWLLIVAAFVCAMVVVGGATRLTGSGLSITEWQPILGVLPPWSNDAWEAAFAKYRAIPEYQLINKGMSLEAFKTLYWWEWGHRLLGRLIGAVFLIPFVYFLARRAIPRPYIGRIAALFLLGAAQGVLGWVMVKSGLIERADVSQYRLAAHLTLAVAIVSYAFWLALSIGEISRAPRRPRCAPPPIHRYGAALLAVLLYLQVIAGGFVAGLKAGHASNTWPLMNVAIIPSSLDVYSPWYINLFENPVTAQFAHRLIAYAAALFAAGLAVMIFRSPGSNSLRLPALGVALAIALQIALGVATIVYNVPLGFALAHQANAILVLAMALWLLHNTTASGRQAAERA